MLSINKFSEEELDYALSYANVKVKTKKKSVKLKLIKEFIGNNRKKINEIEEVMPLTEDVDVLVDKILV